MGTLIKVTTGFCSFFAKSAELSCLKAAGKTHTSNWRQWLYKGFSYLPFKKSNKIAYDQSVDMAPLSIRLVTRS
jgi:hypothetical protein